MFKRIIAALAFLALPAFLYAQPVDPTGSKGVYDSPTYSVTKTLGALNAVASISMSGRQGCSVQIVTANLSGNVTFYASIDNGTTWVNVDPSARRLYNGAYVSDFAFSGGAATEQFEFLPVAGVTNYRVIVNAYTSGSAVATITASTAPSGQVFIASTGGVDVNLTQVGGSGISLGAATVGASFPVTLAVDQPAILVDGSGVTQPVSGTFWQATQPISAAALPLPANAAQETGGNLDAIAASLAGSLTMDLTKVGGASIALGQAAMAASVPVVVASNQTAIPVSGTVSTGGLTDAELRATPVPVSGTVAVSNSFQLDATGAALNVASGTASGATGPLVQGDVATGAPSYTNGQIDPLSLTTHGGLRVSVTNTSGTSITPATETTLSLLPLGQESTTSGEDGPLVQGAVTTAAPTYSDTKTDPLSLQTDGSLRTAVTNTVTVSDGSGALNVIVDSGTLTAVTTITNPVTVTDGAGALNVIVDSGTVAVGPTVTPGQGATNLGKGIAGTISAGDTGVGVFVNGAGSYALPNADINGNLKVIGSVAHDSPATGGSSVAPLLVGGFASAAAPTDVSADGDAVRDWRLRSGAEVVQPAFAGTLADSNSGTKSAGTLRVVIATDQPALTNKLLVTPDSVALPANQSVNVAQVAGTATSVNNGTVDAGTQRVTIASDSTGKVTVTPVAVATSNSDGSCVSVAANTTVLASFATRRGATLKAQCDPSACNTDTVFIKFAATATTSDYPLAPGDVYPLGGSAVYTGIIDAIANSGTQKVCVMEW